MAHVVTPPFSVIVNGDAPPAGVFNWTSQTLNLQQGVSYDLRTNLVNGTGLEPLIRFYDGPTLASFGLTLVQPHTLVVSPTAPLGTFTNGPEFVAQVARVDDVDRIIPDNILAPGEGSTIASSAGVSYYKSWEHSGDFDGLYWANFGGDWKDASGIKQGAQSFSPPITIPSGTSEFNIAADITGLVNDWITGTKRNFGLWLRSTAGAAQIYSKENILGKPKPTLRLNGNVDRVVDGDSYTALAGSASAPGWITPAGAERQLLISTGANGANVFIYVDVSDLVGQVSSAVLMLTTNTVPRSVPVSVVVLRVDMDDMFPTYPYESGYSATYPLDVGIKNNGNTVFAMDFRDYDLGYSAANETRWKDAGWASATPMWNNVPAAPPALPWTFTRTLNAKVISDVDPDNPLYKPLAPGVPAVKSICSRGTKNDGGFFSGSWGFYANLGPIWESFNAARGAPGFPEEPEEIYFRYFLYVDETWDPMPTGGKFWGAWWLYQPDNSYGTIKPPPNPPGPGPIGTYPALKPNAKGYSGNTGIMSWGCAGSSRRGRFSHIGGNDTPILKAGFRMFATIAEDTMGNLLSPIPPGYFLDRAYGHDMNWGWGGWLAKGTWNCIEQRFKQNSIATDGSETAWVGYPYGKRYVKQSDIGNPNSTTPNDSSIRYSGTCSATGTSNTIVLSNRSVSASISAGDSWTPSLVFQPEDYGTEGNAIGWGRVAIVVKTGSWVGTVSCQESLDQVTWTDVTFAITNTNIPSVPAPVPPYQTLTGETHFGVGSGLRYVRAGFKAGAYTSGTLQVTLKNTAWTHQTLDYSGYTNNMTMEWNGQRRRGIAYNPATFTVTISNHLDDAANPNMTTWAGGVPQVGDRFYMRMNTSAKLRTTLFYGNSVGNIYADGNSVINPRLSGFDTVIAETPGIGRFDGIHQTWINGRLVQDQHDQQWRCIREMQIQEITLNSFMGGVSQVPTQDNAVYFALLVCGRERIGITGGLPGMGSTPPPTGEVITRMAQSPSLAHVQAAVTAAVDGDVIGIPNGSATWSGGITTTKQIRIRAQNYTPTPAGTAGNGALARNVSIMNAAPRDRPLFEFQSGNSFHCGVAGIAFLEDGTGATPDRGPHLRFSGNGTKVPLINDCFFAVRQRTGEGAFSTGNSPLVFTCQGGVIWNCYFSSLGFNLNPANGPGTDAFGTIATKPPRQWTTASTMGTLDTGGIVNLYVEDSTFYISAKSIDLDDGGRAVFRHVFFEGTEGVSHGFTSATGGRHIEIYDSEFWNNIDGSHPHAIGGVGRNFNNCYWVRGGTLLMTNNFIDNSNTGFGSPGTVRIGDNTPPSGTYLIPRQPGAGHNGTAHVGDPIYVWNHTGVSPYGLDYNDQPGDWRPFVVQGRDIFMNAGAKPGYSKFTYPHPFRSVVGT